MTIKAIETRYAGCRFRSRLEARWAVFFDTLGIRWEYEPQGYLVGDGKDARPYLPDFWLPDHQLWVEVKGSSATLDLDLLLAATVPHWGLPNSPTGEPCPDPSRAGRRLLLLGQPDAAYCSYVLVFWKGDVLAEPVRWVEGGRELIPGRNNDGSDAPFLRVGSDGDPAAEWPSNDFPLQGPTNYYWKDRRVEAAFNAARSARFEHGQRG